MATFISDSLADKLHCASEPCAVAKFLTIGSSPMTCSRKIRELQWMAQGEVFTIEAVVLHLQCYDVIVGADWLEDRSPMWSIGGRKS